MSDTTHDVITGLARGIQPTESQIEDALYEMCDDLHADACIICPFFKLRDGDIWQTTHRGGCDGFKDGHALRLAFQYADLPVLLSGS